MKTEHPITPPISIEEAKAAKAALRERLRLALREFTDCTGLTVEWLDLTQFTSIGGVYDYSVDVRVQL